MLPLLIAGAAGLLLVMKERPPRTRSELLDEARTKALSMLRSAPRGSIVVFDFDETLVHPEQITDWEHTGVRSVGWASERVRVPIYAPIHPIIDVLQVAARQGFRIVLITARYDNAHTRATVMANLRRRKLTVHEFHARPAGVGVGFKAELRARLAQQRPVALTIGDQWFDVNKPGNAHWIKLPDGRDVRLLASA